MSRPDAGGVDGAGETTSVPLYAVNLAYPPSSALPADEVLVEITVDAVEHILVQVDTASPHTSMPQAQLDALGIAAGSHDVWIGAKGSGIHVGAKQIVAVESIGTGSIDNPVLPPGSVLRGTAGNNLWAGFALGLDLRGGRLSLLQHTKVLDPTTLPHPSGTGAGIAIAAERVVRSGTEDAVLYVSASFDASGIAAPFLIDTGTSLSLALRSYWKTVTPASTKFVPQDSADFQGSPLVGEYRLASGFALAGHSLAALYPVWVLDQFPVLKSVADYFARPIDGLVSLWAFWPYYTVLDFGLMEQGSQPRVFLFPYVPAPKPLLESGFTGYGIVWAGSSSSGIEIVRVVPGSDAEIAGVKDGDVLLSIAGGPAQYLSTGLISDPVGAHRKFTFQRDGAPFEVSLTAEALLGP